jgi:hypothetical protein
MKPFSEASDRNKEPILEVLRKALAGVRSVLEIGSGTGQHAVHFAANMPHLLWQTSDLPENHAGIRAWITEAGLRNAKPPLWLDVCRPTWPIKHADAAFTANTLHIVSWKAVRAMFTGVSRVLGPGPFCTYGPFNYQGRYTSESNAAFDQMLRQRDPNSGIRDVDDLAAVAADLGLTLEADHAMPANNRLLVWRREH